jgi:FeS assembly protein IscX
MSWSRFPNDGDSEITEMAMTWKDAEDIALALMDEHPDVDPLTVRFTDLHKWVVALPEFSDDPKASNEGILEKIQMKWHEEYQER